MSTKEPAKYILFAVQQAKEAEAFGFTRNECNRNLRLAINHYWGKKVCGWTAKSKMPKSEAAIKVSLVNCEGEHVVPLGVIVNLLIEHPNLTIKTVKSILTRYFYMCVVTRSEHRRLNSSGLRFKMPKDWNKQNPWARYENLGIKIVKN